MFNFSVGWVNYMKNGNKLEYFFEWLVMLKAEKKALLFLVWIPLVSAAAVFLKIVEVIPFLFSDLFAIPVLFLPIVWMFILLVSCISSHKLRRRLLKLGGVGLVVTMAIMQAVLILGHLNPVR